MVPVFLGSQFHRGVFKLEHLPKVGDIITITDEMILWGGQFMVDVRYRVEEDNSFYGIPIFAVEQVS